LTTKFRVRPAGAADEAGWRRLWQLYCDFYAVAVPKDVTNELWRRIADGQAAINALVAETVPGAGRRPQLIGMANYVLHPFTWGTEMICYLEDLFVAEDYRGAGAGKAMIETLMGLARQNGWPRLYWHTHEGNVAARLLYERITPRDPFVRYVVNLR